MLKIQINPETRDAALKFLEKKVKGQKIFLKMDATVPNVNQNRAAYINLKNNTFMNAHLIKKGLVNADSSRDYKY